MNNSATQNQRLNIIGAGLGALIGLVTLALAPAPTVTGLFTNLIFWHLGHEAAIASISAIALIVFLDRVKPRGLKAMALCGILGLTCARLTISLIQ
jgi:hypothetical protein